MKMPPDDLELLQRFSRTGDEEAFATLVNRHLPMVYAAARRMAGAEGHLAPDVAQLVFTNLAARLPRVLAHLETLRRERVGDDTAAAPSIVGWLHRDTRYTTMELLRRETRRRRRETATTCETTGTPPDPASEPEPDWARVRLLLDQALDELPAIDREALLLRFFGHRDHASIGEALGRSQDAARKRVERALDRLQQRLAMRGITTTAAALAAACAAHGWEEPPAGLAEKLTRLGIASITPSTTPWFVSLTTLMSSTLAKVVTVTAAIVVLVGLTLPWVGRWLDSEPSPATPDLPNAVGDEATPATTPGMAPRAGGRRPTRAAVDPAEAAALDRLRQVLYAANRRPARVMPDPAVREAIEAWTGSRRVFLPLLREALASDRAEVVSRAAAAVMVLGPEAAACGGDLVRAMRNNSSGHAIVSLGSALAKLGPAPELLPDLVSVLRDKPQHNLAFAQCLSSLAGTDINLLQNTLVPLLQDANPQVQELALGVLANAAPTVIEPEMLRIAVASLRSENVNSQHLGLEILQRAGTDAASGPGAVSVARLGTAADDIVAALIEVANHSPLAERRTRARKLLDRLEPALRRENPDFDRWLKEQEAGDQFRRRMSTETLPIEELVQALTRHPGIAPGIAGQLAERGPEARAALPALHRALAALEPSAGTSDFDRTSALESRGRILEAIRRLAPDQPGPFFSRREVQRILEPLATHSGAGMSEGQGQALRQALASIFPEGSAKPEELQPDQLRQMLSVVGQIDAELRDAMLAATRTVDPNFR